MRKRRRIQLLPMVTPQREVLVHQDGKAIVVASLDEVNELVDDQVLGLHRMVVVKPSETAYSGSCTKRVRRSI